MYSITSAAHVFDKGAGAGYVSLEQVARKPTKFSRIRNCGISIVSYAACT